MYNTLLSLALLAGASSATPILGAPRSVSSVLNVDQSEWDSLNRSVSGRLQVGEPMAEPCFQTVDGRQHTPDNAVCNSIQSSHRNDQFISDHFGGYENVKAFPDLVQPQKIIIRLLTLNRPTGVPANPMAINVLLASYLIRIQSPLPLATASRVVFLRGILMCAMSRTFSMAWPSPARTTFGWSSRTLATITRAAAPLLTLWPCGKF